MGSCRMLNDIAAVKYAVEICNDFDIKKEILCAPGSEYYLYEEERSEHSERSVYDGKEYWTKKLKKKTIEILKNQRLPEFIQEKITGLVILVGMKMLCWAEYHEGMFGLSRERCVDFLNSSFFTSLGLIDNKKAAEQLMNEESLNIEQKYRLACIFCFTDQLPVLFKQIPLERKEAYYDGHNPVYVTQPTLIKFWSYYLMGEIDLLKGGKTLDQYRLENAVKSGSLAAVEYCLQIPNIRRKENILTYAALEAVEIMLKGESEEYVFELEKNDFQSSVWTPEYYYMDLICFLLSKMQEKEKINFLKKDIEVLRYNYFENIRIRHSKVLEYFLDWPYQLYFLETEKLVREFLPARSVSFLLRIICNKIESDEGELNYGSEKCFDYRNLLREFWLKSFDRCNKYTLQDNKTLKNDAFKLTLDEIKDILDRLFTLKNFTYRDLDNILLILNYATYDERKNIISSEKGKNMCFALFRKKRWEVLDKFVLKCFFFKDETKEFKKDLISSEKGKDMCFDLLREERLEELDKFVLKYFFCKDETKEFKKDLISTEAAKDIFRNFMCNYKLDAIHCFLDWISLSQEEVVRYTEEIIFSNEGRRSFMYIVFQNEDNESAYQLCKLLVSAEKVNEFKKILLSEFNFNYSLYDLTRNNCQRTENFLQWATSSTDEIKKLKNDLIYKKMDLFESFLIRIAYGNGFKNCGKIDRCVNYIYFNGSDWISAEKLLTWCLSEREILEYKKVLLERFGVKIHFQLIRANQWAEAETFFSWLGLNIRDIQQLKKDTIFENIRTILSDLKDTENYSTYDGFVDYNFAAYGGLQDRLELLLRWCLCDRESVLEFKTLLEEFDFKSLIDKLKRYSKDTDFKNILNNFNLAIGEYLIELEPDHFKSKRKSEVLSSPKKIYKKCLISKCE